MHISDWSSDVCSSDLLVPARTRGAVVRHPARPVAGRGGARLAVLTDVRHENATGFAWELFCTHRVCLAVPPPTPSPGGRTGSLLKGDANAPHGRTAFRLRLARPGIRHGFEQRRRRGVDRTGAV